MSTTMDSNTLHDCITELPCACISFYPTPFHKVMNLSKTHGINIFMKHEDLTGSGTISRSKTHLSKFILGSTRQQGYTHIITQGIYLTNSSMQFTAACHVAGMTLILFLTQDTEQHSQLEEYRGNLLLTQILGVETHCLKTGSRGYWNISKDSDQIAKAMQTCQANLEAEGHCTLIVLTGGAHPLGFIAHLLTFLEIIKQSELKGVSLNYIYHTAGTGTALPGLLASKFMTGHPMKFRSIVINLYSSQSHINPSVIVDCIKVILECLGASVLSDKAIHSEINIDERFISDNYAVPSAESIAAIQELSQADRVFLGPVYTGKGFTGLLDHVHHGKVHAGANVVFLHTGDTANLFEVSTVISAVADAVDESFK